MNTTVPKWLNDLTKGGYKFTIRDGSVIAPTLSELIEACGDDFFDLTKTVKGWWSRGGVFGSVNKLMGETPEEAVVYLYLELNKKS